MPTVLDFTNPRVLRTEAEYEAAVGEIDALLDADPVEGSETLTEENRVAEQVYLGLRSVAGLVLAPGEDPLVAAWIASGWALVTPDGRLALTPEGWLRMDALAQSLTLSRSR